MSSEDYSNIPTPEAAYADFCLIPVGTGSVSVANEVAQVQRLLKASGLKYTMHSAGTTVAFELLLLLRESVEAHEIRPPPHPPCFEGSWDDVFRVIGQAHSLVHQSGVVRIQSSMRVGSRTDKKQSAADKVARVEGILAQDK